MIMISIIVLHISRTYSIKPTNIIVQHKNKKNKQDSNKIINIAIR